MQTTEEPTFTAKVPFCTSAVCASAMLPDCLESQGFCTTPASHRLRTQLWFTTSACVWSMHKFVDVVKCRLRSRDVTLRLSPPVAEPYYVANAP